MEQNIRTQTREPSPSEDRNTTDPLTAAYMALADMQNIEDIQDYARAWAELSEIAALEDRPALAAMCASRAAFYGREPAGEYVRMIDGAFAELIPA